MTNENKIAFYQDVLHYLISKDKEPFSLCWIIKTIYHNNIDSRWLNEIEMSNIFPEFFEDRPEHVQHESALISSAYQWWPMGDIEPRIIYLKSIIKKLT